MAHLFSSLVVASITLTNRVAMAALPSGHATTDGFVSPAMYEYYVERAHGGVGLIITEPAWLLPPAAPPPPHLGIYHDAFARSLRHLAHAVHGAGGRLLVPLTAPADLLHGSTSDLRDLGEHFMRAAWRVHAAQCDGVVLSAADGGVLHLALSPRSNQRNDPYGGSLSNRMRLLGNIVDGIREWLGPSFVLAVELIAEEFDTHGITMQEVRMCARRLAAAGINLVHIQSDTRTNVPIARFPGWQVPLASAIKQVLPDVPVISSGLLDDPYLADSVIREGSADMVLLDEELQHNAYWAHHARIILESDNGIYIYP